MEWEDIFGKDADRHARPQVSAALATLQTACETEPPVSFLAAHMTLSCTGRLKRAESFGVTIDLPNPPIRSIHAGATAAIRFPLAGRAAGFTSTVISVTELGAGALRLILEVPDEIRTDEQRAAVRIPVPDNTLAAALLDGETPIAVRAIDISLLGMCIELREGTSQNLESGHRRMIALKLGAVSEIVETEVRRCDGMRRGLAFILRDERPPALVKIVSKLQYIWSAT